ncbi:DUF4314 domain-containing protein [Micromonospora sp. MA102]|uniref:DUF4314 domain-containing protein n=1 Tax=Micromonospora sp. MA102 TaxID=2952755 RepID=UPI0021CAD77B|nr:DUF4314 domain-containing protein [Micromonospora sp. MA102]
MTYQPGDRIALEHTSDLHTRLRRGDQGTVRSYDPRHQVLDVQWDSGSRLSMLLGAGAGDRVRRLPETGWERALDALREAGAAAGRNAAQWWAQDTLGGRASGDVTATARKVLSAVEAADGRDIDGLPAADRYVLADDADRYAEHAPPDAPAWERLTAQQRDQARWAWCDGYDAAAEAEAARQCRMLLHPDGDDRDLRHVHPDRVGLGGPGVFAGDWAWTPNEHGELRIPVGFVGTLVDTWNGWAVFTCTREVAEAIVVDQHDARDRYRQHLAATGITGERQEQMVDESMARLRFDGDVIVVDETRVYDDPEAIERIPPDADGRYTVMGRAWTWMAVHPYDCERIAGDLPGPPATAAT